MRAQPSKSVQIGATIVVLVASLLHSCMSNAAPVSEVEVLLRIEKVLNRIERAELIRLRDRDTAERAQACNDKCEQTYPYDIEDKGLDKERAKCFKDCRRNSPYPAALGGGC